uniref:protein MODIFYING WALL LIGNIN-2-like n=1 Tax=Erigeron canadensis TaxID=72917 RepID=UPI001CB91382|nr:protein MODIFYING WALL LIGNIN-2-like [Erigeron canadensis]
MEKQYQTKIISHVLVIATIISLSLASFALCIICEIKKSKKKELRVDGELCYLPQSHAYGYGIAALICSSIAQIIGTIFFIFVKRSSDLKSTKTSFASILVFFSWTSFLIATILDGAATSMSREQAYGEGWKDDGTCYLVKNGVFVGSGVLVIVAISLILLSYYNLTLNKNRGVHVQLK